VADSYDAVRVKSSVSEATGWLVETWELRGLDRVQIYQHRGAWHAWCATCSCRLRDLNRALATRRNVDDLDTFRGLVPEAAPVRELTFSDALRRMSLRADDAPTPRP
jgi:hypothetical protein